MNNCDTLFSWKNYLLNMGRTEHSQFELMVDFMEKHGDIKWCGNVGAHERLDSLTKWLELVDLLNNSGGPSKSLDKWRKVWSDFKNNTRKKLQRIQNGAVRADITPLELRVLKIIDKYNKSKDENAEKSNEMQFKFEIDSVLCRTKSPPESNFVSVDEQDNVSQDRRQSFSSTSSSESSLETDVSPRKKRRKTEGTLEVVKEITDKFLEYEKKKDKMAHEQEMARIKQNEQLLTIVGRMVNALETLAPSIQKFLNQNNSGDG